MASFLRSPVGGFTAACRQRGFDALEFSKKAGDYPEGGKDKGGSWMFDFASDPRRKKIEVEEKKTNPH